MLRDVLAPMTEEEFFREYWTKKFVHIPGPETKFVDLFPWDALNKALEQHRFDPKRLHLVKSGKDLQAETYLHGAKVESAKLTEELANGATLVLNDCEEIHPPLRELCVHLEKRFHVYVNVNLYAGWRTDHGFDIHWDDQDTLILQVSGRKSWKVWEPTRLHPFKKDIVDTSAQTKPNAPPIWDGVLEQGGLLCMPRGWWHVANPLDEPCLHLTVTIKNLNGIDFLHWLANELKASEHARMELPIVNDREERRLWLEGLWQELSGMWSGDLIERFISHVDGQALSRPAMHLPKAAANKETKIQQETPLQLVSPRPLHFEGNIDPVRFKAAGIDWQTSVDLVPILERFNDGKPHTLAELAPPGDYRLSTLLMALAIKGVVRPIAL
jgi:ribosomal protein L16 Arg81 hydroxylase